MSNMPETLYGGTKVERTLTISIAFDSYTDDPKRVQVGQNTNETYAEFNLNGFINGVMNQIKAQTGKDMKAYFSNKTNTLYISSDPKSQSHDYSDMTI